MKLLPCKTCTPWR